MRLLIIVLSILLLTGVFGFVVMNLDATVAVTVWNTHHEAVPLHLVILVSLVAGIVYIGIIAVAEGVNTRLDRRRLAREVQRLEGELNYLRTQPTGSTAEAGSRGEPEPPAAEPGDEDLVPYDDGATLPSAPVYGANDEEDDDVYSGGRAV
jgi:uncharacterized integral membrane protein